MKLHRIRRGLLACLVVAVLATALFFTWALTPPPDDAVSRVVTVFNNLIDEAAPTDAVSRSVSVFNDLIDETTRTDAVSRPVTVFNDLVNESQPIDAVSREVGLFNDVASVDPDFDGVLTSDGDGTNDPCTSGQRTSCDDNCATSANPTQRDGDANGLGDVCDLPKVVSVLPGDNTTNVGVWSNITVTFSEPVSATTVGDTNGDGTPDTFRLLRDGVPVPAKVGLAKDGTRATLEPIGALTEFTVYTVELSAAIRDLQTNPIPSQITAFQTGSANPNSKDLGTNATQSQGTQANEELGTSISAAGDINHDGLMDWIVGAPGYDQDGTVDRGRALLYLGSTDPVERNRADVVFVGPRLHGAAGISVAGGVDVNGDGTTDILIGADDHDGTTAYGPGRAYLVYFNPADYPNFGQPGVTVTVNLASVVDVEFVGKASGDRAGHAVALSPDITREGRGEVLVGAPGAERSGKIDCGEAYLIDGGAWTTSTVDLSLVGAPTGIFGIAYVGEANGDALGWSVGAGRDVNGDGTADVIIGAPLWDRPASFAPAPDAGASYVDYGAFGRGITEIDKIGSGGAGGKPGTKSYGDLPGMQLGTSVTLVADHDGDGYSEIVLGAPFANVSTRTAAGEAFLIPGGAAVPGTIDTTTVRDGNSHLGIVFQGSAAGDRLGAAVGDGADVNNDGVAELLLGAPGFDASSPPRIDAGAMYVAMGAYVRLDLGALPVDAIGRELPGALYFGQSAGDAAGSAVAGVGDTSGDGLGDLEVGAPKRDVAATNDAGTAYLITEQPAPVPSGVPPCGPAGCSVTDLDTGSRLDVPAGALGASTSIGVDGSLDPSWIPTPPPPGLALLGAARFTPDGLSFTTPKPTAHIGTRPVYDSQIALGELFRLRVLTGGVWTDSGIDAIVENAPFYGPPRHAVTAPLTALRYYAAFIGDIDNDGTRDSNDPDRDGDGTANGSDNCPDRFNPYQWDCNNNGAGDACDIATPDTDGDTRADACDNCVSTPNPNQLNQDSDGLGDACDTCPLEAPNDQDGDGVCCPLDNCCAIANPSQRDTDRDGVGDACDSDPVLRVSSDPADGADFATIQAAINAASQSGTRIEILPGLGPYNESVTIDRGMTFDIKGVQGATDSSGPIVINGGGGPALRFLSSAGSVPMRLSALTLSGSKGVESTVAVEANELTLASISGVGLDLGAASHQMRRVVAGSGVAQGVVLSAGGALSIEDSRLDQLGSVVVTTLGALTARNVVITAGTSDAIVVQPTGSLALSFATIASNTGRGVVSIGGASATISSSILWGNAAGDLVGVACGNVSNSDIGNPDCSATGGNIAADPLFAAGYALGNGSPCVDRGPAPSTFTGSPCHDTLGGPRLRDYDGDGIAKWDIGAYEKTNTALQPGDVSGLVLTTASALSWNALPTATVYHVYRGTVATLSYGSYGNCFVDVVGTGTTDNSTPPAGGSWFYVVTGENGAGEEGTKGYGTCAERSNYAACP